MEKTIADRLREAGDSNMPWLAFVKAEGFSVLENDGKVLAHIADEIEREYAVRPRLHGNPVQEGGIVCNSFDGAPGKVRGVAVIDGKPNVLIERQGWYGEDEIALPCLDADGVPHRLGDSVWSLVDDTKRKVLGFDFEHAPEFVVMTETGRFSPDMLTHKEPVSLKGLLDYVNEQADKCDSRFEPLNEIGRQLAILIDRS